MFFGSQVSLYRCDRHGPQWAHMRIAHILPDFYQVESHTFSTSVFFVFRPLDNLTNGSISS